MISNIMNQPPTPNDLLDILKKRFGFESFRELWCQILTTDNQRT
jgi:hypothetical protein